MSISLSLYLSLSLYIYIYTHIHNIHTCIYYISYDYIDRAIHAAALIYDFSLSLYLSPRIYHAYTYTH